MDTFIVLGVNHYEMENGNKGLFLVGYDGEVSKDNNSFGFSVCEMAVTDFDLLNFFKGLDINSFPFKITYKSKLKSMKNKSGKPVPTVVLTKVNTVETGTLTFKPYKLD